MDRQAELGGNGQIVTLDTRERAIRLLATVTNPVKLKEVDEQLRMMLDL